MWLKLIVHMLTTITNTICDACYVTWVSSSVETLSRIRKKPNNHFNIITIITSLKCLNDFNIVYQFTSLGLTNNKNIACNNFNCTNVV